MHMTSQVFESSPKQTFWISTYLSINRIIINRETSLKGSTCFWKALHAGDPSTIVFIYFGDRIRSCLRWAGGAQRGVTMSPKRRVRILSMQLRISMVLIPTKY
jgi:hypothetical protein